MVRARRFSCTDGMSRVLEALQDLFRWGLKPSYARESLLYLALAFRRRIPQALDLGPLSAPPSIDSTNEEDSIPALPAETTKPEPPHLLIEPTTLKTIGVLSEYEARLFQQWALHVAWSIYQNHPVPRNTLYDEDANNNTPPDELFWKDGMEGTGEVEWREVTAVSASGSPVSLLKRRRMDTRLGYSYDAFM
jgi:hypothetical protein